ncbi:MAG: hypothetical protein R3C61_00920 [Bacteroidia bacterium]
MKSFFTLFRIRVIVAALVFLGGIRVLLFTRNTLAEVRQEEAFGVREDTLQHANAILEAQQQRINELRKQSKIKEKQQKVTGFTSYLENLCKGRGVKITVLPVQVSTATDRQLIQFQLHGKFPELLEVVFQMEVADEMGRIIFLRWFRQKVVINGQSQQLLVAEVKIER